MSRKLSAALVSIVLGAVAVGCDDDQDDRAATTPASTGTTPATSPAGTAEQDAEPPADVRPEITHESVTAALGEIDGFVEAEMDFFGVPGVAVAVVYDDEVVFSRGYGVREVGTTEAVDEDTVFQLASLSKAVSSTAIAGLVSDAVIGWDDPVHPYSPELVFNDPYVTDHVTFADLYSHRSGLPGLFGNTLEHIGYTRDEILARVRLLPLDAFRASYSYSNFGMTAAGDAAAKAAGLRFDELMDRELFVPAGMTSSSARHADLVASPNRSAIHVKIDDRWVVGPERQPDAQAPAGGVSSSLADLSTWTRLVLGAGTLDGEEIVGEEALTETHAPHILRQPLAAYDDQAKSYGLGWNVENDHLGFLRWGHSGAFSAGAATNATLLPTEGLGVVVLTNGMPLGIPEILVDEIIDQIATGGQTQPWRAYWYDDRFSQIFAVAPIDRPENATPALANAAYVGIYRNDYYGDVRVIAQGNGLAIVEGPAEHTYPMTHVDGNTFAITAYAELPDAEEPITFTVTDGQVTGLDIGDSDGPGTGQLARVV